MDNTTKLSAVNSMLATIGEAPINTLSNLVVVDAITAVSTLDEVVRSVLVEGYTFNTDRNFPLYPEAFTPWEIKTPNNALSVVPSGSFSGLVVRGGKIYDPSRFSFSFQGFSVVTCDVIWNMEFEDIPEVTRQYAYVKAARLFQKRAVTSEVVHQLTAEDERMALWAHRRANTRIKQKKFLIDSESVRSIHQTR